MASFDPFTEDDLSNFKRQVRVVLFFVLLAALTSPAIAMSDAMVPQPALKPLVGIIFFLVISIGGPVAYFASWSD